MSSVSLTGSDTININDRIFADLADGDAVTLNFPNEITATTVGKNGNAIYALNETGEIAEVSIRVLRGSPDDKYLNGLISLLKSDFASFPLIYGEFIKRVGDGKGNVASDTYILSGGIPSTNVGTSSNNAGDTEQSVSVYNIRFAKAPRTIG